MRPPCNASFTWRIPRGHPVLLLALISNRTQFVRVVRSNWRLGMLGGFFYLTAYGLVLFAFSLDAVAKIRR